MIKKLLLVGFIAAMGSISVNAQVADNAIKTNIFGAFVGQYQLAYERALNENLSAQLSVGLISRTWESSASAGSFTSSTEQKDGGFLVIPEVRYYFTEGLKGFYGSAFARYRTGTTTVTTTFDDSSSETEYTRNAVGGGLLVGYQFLFNDRIALDIFIGPQFKSVSSEVSSNDDEDDTTTVELEGESSGAGVRFGVNFGVAF